jgi:hypothetical protein
VTGEFVNVDTFVRAETNRMFAFVLKDNDVPVGVFAHNRTPTPLDRQPVIRQNRDTLYSAAVLDITGGATLTLPDTGGRYISAMVINQDHYINRVYHDPGEQVLAIEEFDTPYVMVAVRILADPANPADVAEVNALQDQIQVTAGSNQPFDLPDYDEKSFTATRTALLQLARGLDGFDRAFGSRESVDPVRHLVCTAAGWGGLPEQEARYLNVDPGLPVGEFQLTVPADVPVDAFWSISLYNAEGYFEPNRRNLNSVNSITATPNADGSITVNFGVSDEDKPNYFPIMEGWNYMVRLYRPRPEVLDGSWAFPAIQPA